MKFCSNSRFASGPVSGLKLNESLSVVETAVMTYRGVAAELKLRIKSSYVGSCRIMSDHVGLLRVFWRQVLLEG